jgi:hypothetical protein
VKARASWAIVAGTVVVAWLSAFIGGVCFLAVPAFLVVLVWLIRRRRWRPLVALLVTSPFAFAAVFAAVTYARGSARLLTVGLPGPDFYNVNPSTRYQSSSSGCIVDGSEWVLQLPNNLTLLALRAVLGPMPGAYDGPYPTDDEITGALRSAAPLNWAELERDNVSVGGGLVPLRTGIGSDLAKTLRTDASDAIGPSLALWQERVLLLRFPSPFAELTGDAPFIVLVDRTTGKVIAYKGRSPLSTRDLPEQWS